MLRLEISAPADLSAQVQRVLSANDFVSSLAVFPGASVLPPGDVITADLPREGANAILDELTALGVQEEGTLSIADVESWASRRAFDAERAAPGYGADSVVWVSLVKRAYDDAELNWMYVSFMIMATLLASIAIVVDSQILTIGAMVLGPEFGPVAALGVAIVRGRWRLLGRALRTLLIGFACAIVVVTILALIARELGWVHVDDVTDARPGTDFIYSPDQWSFIVAIVAGAAGVLSMTSSRLGGLSGVFISVTTVPAIGNIAIAAAFGVGEEIRGSALQLGLNITGMAIAGWLTLTIQSLVWRRVAIRRASWRAGFGSG